MAKTYGGWRIAASSPSHSLSLSLSTSARFFSPLSTHHIPGRPATTSGLSATQRHLPCTNTCLLAKLMGLLRKRKRKRKRKHKRAHTHTHTHTHTRTRARARAARDTLACTFPHCPGLLTSRTVLAHLTPLRHTHIWPVHTPTIFSLSRSLFLPLCLSLSFSFSVSLLLSHLQLSLLARGTFTSLGPLPLGAPALPQRTGVPYSAFQWSLRSPPWTCKVPFLPTQRSSPWGAWGGGRGGGRRSGGGVRGREARDGASRSALPQWKALGVGGKRTVPVSFQMPRGGRQQPDGMIRRRCQPAPHLQTDKRARTHAHARSH